MNYTGRPKAVSVVLKSVLVVLVAACLVSLGAAGGLWLQKKRQLYEPVRDAITNSKSYVVVRNAITNNKAYGVIRDAITSVSNAAPEWRDVSTNLHQIQVVTFKVSNVVIKGGSIAEAGGNIVIASPEGQLSYLDSRYRLHPLDISVPMNIEGLRGDPLYKNPLFNMAYVRTYDLLAIPTGAQTYHLYASFSRFAGHCFDFVVSRISLELTDQALRPIGQWQDLWTATPCVPLKDRATPFVGEEGGGRMVQYGNDKILVSVGDFQLDGFYDSRAVAMDPAFDLGKLIEVDIQTGTSRQFANGLRNPQGLTIARDGVIWETEHGPQGGDEVNLMIEGRNYGWPVVTYGMAYGFPPKNWPSNPKPGRHDGYERPRFAFVPSIGISNIIEPDPREFPNWSGTLLFCSLKAQTLYLLKIEGDEIVYAEPLLTNGYRFRDIAVLHDGRLAILADFGTLLLVRNAEKHRGEAQFIEVSGFSSLPPPLPDEAPSRAMTAVDRGRQYFLGTCGSCHSLAGDVGTGPPLNGVIGRRIAAVSEFGYSAALDQNRDKVWTESLIISYANNPKAFAPGTSMSNTGIYVDQMQDIVAYLETTQ